MLPPSLARRARLKGFLPPNKGGLVQATKQRHQESGTTPQVEVWSFNLRTEKAKEADAANSWAQRRDEVALFISKYSPAIVCAQEATGAMLSHLSDELGGRYAWKGTSRKLEVEDECAGFLFDAEQVELESHGCFWLAPPGTPKGIGLRMCLIQTTATKAKGHQKETVKTTSE